MAALAFGVLPISPASAAIVVDDACGDFIGEDGFTDTGPEDADFEANDVEDAVDCLVAYGITVGKTATTFDTGGIVTRAQLATFMLNILDTVNGFMRPTPGDVEDTFPDDDDSVHEDNINQAAALGIIQGYKDGTFRPAQGVTRAQMATFIIGTLEEAGFDVPEAVDDAFPDDEESVHENNINRLEDLDVVDGEADGNYNPEREVTRGTMAFFLTRVLELLVDNGLTTPLGGDRVVIDQTTVPQGGTVTGTISNADAATVSGCGVTNLNLVDTDSLMAGLQFSFPIPTTQPVGDCTLTFTITNPDGTTTTETATLTVTAGAGAALTARPELTAAAIGASVAPGFQTPTNPAGTRVTYTFDENVDLFLPTGANFHVYNTAGLQVDADTGVVLNVTDNTVTVNFPAITGTIAQTLTLATVDFDAVTDDTGLENPEGDAPIGTAATPGTAPLPAGTTTAPDLLTVGNFRASATAGFTAVDFTFDEAAFVTGASPLLGGAIPIGGTGGFALVQTDGTQLNCAAPLASDPAGAVGGTVTAGNGTSTITVLCQNDLLGLLTAPTLTVGSIARGTVDEGAVSDAAAGGNTNALQAADVANAGNSEEPDLVSATFQPSAGATDDQVLFVFDEAIASGSAVAANFGVYDVAGNTVDGTSATVSPTDPTQVLVNFPDGTLATSVGANVVDGAVLAADNAAANEQDEVGVAGVAPVAGLTPGATTAPELRAVALNAATGTFGSFTATYTFDEPIAPAAIVPGDFYLYLGDGTRLVATGCAQTGPAGTIGASSVTCTTYNTAAGAAATSTQIGNAVVGTVDDGAVVDLTATPNPEGAEPTSGGTGTPVL